MSEPRLPKRERTRRKLLDAGLRVLAERGDALTASDVVIEADVSNGTFYNHFVDREHFIQTLASESLRTITAISAEETKGADPAWSFAVATTRVLDAAAREPIWARAALRLAEHPTPPQAGVQEHLRFDLAEGHRRGRFSHGDDPVTVDLVIGTLMASIRRLLSQDGQDVERATVADVVARLLEAIGIDGDEAQSLALAARDAEFDQEGPADTKA